MLAASPSRWTYPGICFVAFPDGEPVPTSPGNTPDGCLTGRQRPRKATGMSVSVADKPGTGARPAADTLARLLSLGRPLVMGILNVTPDSFSDGGQFFDPATAISHARVMIDQ